MINAEEMKKEADRIAAIRERAERRKKWREREARSRVEDIEDTRRILKELEYLKHDD